jgi:hypothetical protein
MTGMYNTFDKANRFPPPHTPPMMQLYLPRVEALETRETGKSGTRNQGTLDHHPPSLMSS